MKRWSKRFGAFLMALLMMFSVVRQESAAVLEGVYFTAVNDLLLELTGETMPFWLNGVMYVSEKIFEDAELGVTYVHNYSKGLVMMYTPKKDLRFDLVNSRIYDKNGVVYSGSAIEKNGYVFFPLNLVCRYFGLSWSLSDTAYVPLVRIKSEDAVLSDRSFIDAASLMMANRYAAYEKLVNSSQEEDTKDDNINDNKEDNDNKGNEPQTDPPPIHALDGQKVYLILAGKSEESISAAMDILGESPATFLLTARQMEDGDLVRALLGRGHGIALWVQSGTADEIREELLRAREMVWMASCSLLQLVWYEGGEDLTPLLEELGCVSVTAELDRRNEPFRSQNAVTTLMRLIGRYREDVSVFMGNDSDCADRLDDLLSELIEAQYRLCAWRLTV